MLRLVFLLSLFYSVKTWPNFELYTRSNPHLYTTVCSETLNNSSFSHLKETKFLVHGFSANSSALLKIKTELVVSHDLNVIVVDWKEGSQAPDYFKAVSNTREVGRKIAKFIQESKISVSKVHCIGHSLGAHVCGFAGKVKRLGRISGMDPAGPLFKGTPSFARLDKNDADFVDIIHTDSFLGIQDAIGHVDFYPNGGQVQPGCLTKSNQNISSIENERIQLRLGPSERITSFFSCSHTQSHHLYAKSISKCSFKSVPCSSYDEFLSGECKVKFCLLNLSGCVSMGFKAHKFVQHGKYYLNTTKESC